MPKIKLTILALTALAAACGSDEPERAKIDAQVTETRMDDIDQIEGTINDDMINVDESTDQAPLAKDEGKARSAKNDTPENSDDKSDNDE